MSFTYPIELFEDKHLRNRLSSRYWVDNLVNLVSVDELNDAFYAICPHRIDLHHSYNLSEIYAIWKDRDEKAKWCSEYTSGYWIDSNFPKELNIPVARIMGHVYSFQSETDAVMFKLAFG
jgi:hypothetical protein